MSHRRSCYSALNRKESRGAHQRLDGFDQRDDANYLKHSLAHYAGAGPPRIDYGAGSNHPDPSPGRVPMAPPASRQSGTASVARRSMNETRKVIAIEVLRYRPELDEKPFFQTYQVPFTEEMSVLQGLHYIKDELDGTLSFRWSCRMAICGSCGMMIDGIPKLGLPDLPARLLSEQGARRSARPFSDRTRPGRRARRLHRQA